MNKTVQTQPGQARRAKLAQAPIGPGRLVLVVGPSGAGKDTLLKGARQACATESALKADVVFARRIVTRPPTEAEDNASCSIAEFDRAAADGAFALAWSAHGHKYAIPSAIDDDIRAGRTIVCNVSRTVIEHARRRYRHVSVVLVTAPPDVLAARLSQRMRASDGDIVSRLQRAVEVELACEADVTIQNIDRPDIGVRCLLGVIAASVSDGC